MPTIKTFEERHPHLMPLSELWKLNYKALVFYAKSIIHNDQEAEDMAVRVFEKIIYTDVYFETAGKARSFILLTTRNLCIDYLRNKNYHDRVHQQIIAEAAMMAEMQTGNDYDLMYAEYIQILYLEMQSLPTVCKDIFRKIFFEGKSTTEIAQEMNISEQTVRNQKTKAVKLLRSAMLKKSARMTVFLLQMTLPLCNND